MTLFLLFIAQLIIFNLTVLCYKRFCLFSNSASTTWWRAWRISWARQATTRCETSSSASTTASFVPTWSATIRWVQRRRNSIAKLADKAQWLENLSDWIYLIVQGAEPKIIETYSKLTMRDAIEVMRRNPSTLGQMSGTESMSALFRNYTFAGRSAVPSMPSMLNTW